MKASFTASNAVLNAVKDAFGAVPRLFPRGRR